MLMSQIRNEIRTEFSCAQLSCEYRSGRGVVTSNSHQIRIAFAGSMNQACRNIAQSPFEQLLRPCKRKLILKKLSKKWLINMGICGALCFGCCALCKVPIQIKIFLQEAPLQQKICCQGFAPFKNEIQGLPEPHYYLFVPVSKMHFT